MARKNSSDLQTIIDSIKAIHKQIDEATQSEEFSAFVEGIKETFSFIGTLIIPLKGIMPFVLAEMKEQGITFEDLQQSTKAKKQWQGIIKGANRRAAAYKKANEFLSAGVGSIEDALTFKMEAEDIASALLPQYGEDTAQKLLHEWFRLDYTKDPEDAIARWRTPEQSEIWDAIIRKYRRDFAERVSQETGVPVEQLIDNEKRTQEQSDAAFGIFLQAQKEREDIILNSRYASAVKVLKADAKRGKAFTLARMAILYFFATLPQDAPGIIEPGELTEQEAQEVKEAYRRLTAYDEENPFDGQDTVSFLLAFIRETNTEDTEQTEAAIVVIAQELKKIDFPLDRLNSKIRTDIEMAQPSGQLAMDFDFSKHTEDLTAVDMRSKAAKKAGKSAYILYGLSFKELPEEVKITKKILPFDWRCHDAVAALKKNGNDFVSLTQIYKAMGRLTKPNARDLKKIDDSLTKMRAALIYIDTANEKDVNKSYPTFHYDGDMLPFERVKACINGRETATAIHILTEPPLMRFARERKQITTLPFSVRSTPLSMTDMHIRIEDYLTGMISHMKNNPKLERKITEDTIFERCGVETKVQKTRARAAIKELLEYWRGDCGFIGKGSKLDGKTVVLDLNTEK